jgi:hypothetical protein
MISLKKEKKRKLINMSELINTKNIISLTRNDITITTQEDTLGKRAGVLQGTAFPLLKFTPVDINNAVAFLGAEFVTGVLNSAVRKSCVESFQDTYDVENGDIDLEKYANTLLEAFSETTSVSDIVDELDQLATKINKIVLDPDFVPGNKFFEDNNPLLASLCAKSNELQELREKYIQRRAAAAAARALAKEQKRIETEADLKNKA